MLRRRGGSVSLPVEGRRRRRIAEGPHDPAPEGRDGRITRAFEDREALTRRDRIKLEGGPLRREGLPPSPHLLVSLPCHLLRLFF